MDFIDSTLDVVILLFAGTACAVILAIVLAVCVKYVRDIPEEPEEEPSVFSSEDDTP